MASSGALTQPRISALDLTARAFARWEQSLALIIAAVVFGAVQSGTSNIIGIDGQYHIKVAALILDHGPRLDFPYLRFTILNEADYTDHHLLFHLLQAPFTLLDLRLAAKLSAAVFAALSFWGCYLIMVRCRVRWPLAWLVLLLAVSNSFLWRHSMARPQSLALLLLIATLWLTFERRLPWLLLAGFVSAWLFDGFVLTLGVPLAWLAARLFVDRRLDPRPLGYVLLGTVLGIVLHPYFPNNAIFAALHLFPKGGLLSQEAVRVGGEWYPYSQSAFVRRVGPSLAVMVLGMVPILVRLWRREQPEVRSAAMLFMALGFLAMQVRSQRIIEYYPAFAVLSAAWGWSFVGLPRPPRLASFLAGARPWLLAGCVLVLAGWLGATVSQARRDAGGAGTQARLDSYRDAALWVAANSPPRSLIFNTDWDDFPQLFFWNDHNDYVVGLDPTYMSLYNEDLYRLWRAAGSGAPEASSVLRERFGASFVITDTQHTRFLSSAAADPGLEEVFRSPAAVVFRVRPAP